MSVSRTHFRTKFLVPSLCVLLGGALSPAIAALTDLSDKPLSSASSADVYPNILFVLDNSGSMSWDYMPDSMSSRTNRIGFRQHQCNLVYYNPGVRYDVPPTSTNGKVNSATQTAFTAAYNDGFYSYDGNGSTTTNLSTSFKSNSSDSSQAAYYWKYLGATTLVPLTGDCEKSLTSSSDTTTKEYCTDGTQSTTTCAGSGKTALWRKITVSSTSGPATADINADGVINSSDADERQNFANWYSYYRIRLNMMKSAAARAFVNMGDTKRIGFVTINPGSPVSSSKFLTIANYDTTHKADWFTKLYSQNTTGSTPLREALSRAGRYFAGKTDGINSGMTGDPVQYSCQQNFTILTTDGYWNGNAGVQLNGSTAIGNQDGVISDLDDYRPDGSKYAMSPRPIYDGASQTYVWNSASNQYRNGSCVFSTQAQQRTVQTQQRTQNSLLKRTARFRKCTGTSGNWGTCADITFDCASGTGDATKPNCRTSSDSGWATAASCTAGTSGTTTTLCSPASDTGWVNVGTCTASSSGGVTVTCQTASDSGWVNVASCSASSPASGPTVTCQNVNVNGYIVQYLPTTTATTYPGPNQTGSILSGPTSTIGTWTNLPSSTCAATQYALPANGAVTGVGPPSPPTDCSAWPCEIQSAGGGGTAKATSSASFVADADPANPGVVTITTSSAHSFLVGHSVTIASVTPSGYRGTYEIIEVPDNTHFKYYLQTDPGGAGGAGTATLSAGSSDSLSDVAQYYYKTDLRTSALGNCTGALGGSTSVCDNNVPSSGNGVEDDRASWQHMTTFTMGLGLTGTVQYSPTYKTDSRTNNVTWPTTSGQINGKLDFQDIRLGTANWPIPVADSATALDDLWHAAVNGRGQYFSAADPDTVVTSLTNALAGISARVASAAAAATSNLEPVAGDNFAYTAKYKTQAWTGDLEAHEINLSTGAVDGTVVWSAQTKLDAVTSGACDNRTIKLFRTGATNNLADFKWNTDTCDAAGVPIGSPQTTITAAEQANFDATKVALFSHYSVMGTGSGLTVDQRTPAAGANLLNYLRGQRGKEGFSSGPPITNTDLNKLYRAREHVLGDIISAQPVFVKAPFAQYDDAGYLDFKAANSSRTSVVFAAANDGMLHAFYAGSSVADTNGGVEAWAFIPTMVLPNLYDIASENYQHVYSVDGTPSVGDVYKSTAPVGWKTILVAGLNKGGKGYYALDITDPLAPKGLWEFKHSTTCYDETDSSTWYADCHIGYTFNNPIISKLRDGRWVVFVTSGYNNVNSPVQTGDGIGYLYVLDAMTGEILYKISTGVGSSTDPSGLNHINAWSENSLRNNQTERVYGVDLKGNVWRFDVNDILGPAGREATLIATVVDPSGVAQSITTRPELAAVANEPYIYVATGRYLGAADSSNTQTNSVWALHDGLGTTALTNLRTATLKKMTIANQGSGTTAYRTISCTANCGATDGWFADLPDSGERVNIDMKLQLGTLVVASNVPQSNACNIGGYAWLNYFNNSNGEALANSENHAVVRRLVGAGGTESLAVGINIVRLPGGKTVVIATTSAAEQLTVEAPFDVPPPSGRRVSWREVIQ